MNLTLDDVLARQAGRLPEAPAILAPGRRPLTYARLYAHVEDVGRALASLGVARGDRVAVVLPNGPEMAVAVLAVASRAACAPLNPSSGPDELDRFLTDLRPRALVTSAGGDSPARRAATARSVRIVELAPVPDAEAGLFTLVGLSEGPAPPRETVRPDDVALLLLTSATTARAKVVPLTHANVCASASASRAALALTPRDRGLNVLPLFHGHGLIATVMASVEAGAGVVCAPRPDIASFFAWLTEFRVTWYSAVPTIHQAILGQALRDPDRVPVGQLRVIRSGSAPLRPRLLAELERIFDAPVVEFYGMTEVAAAPIACNPLPPGRRKPGSVGVRAGLDVAILDEGGRIVPDGQPGEVVVRGTSVMRGYEAASMVDGSPFADGWFRTGDLGVFDDDGYLFLTGRSKEIINRGGEKIAPQEIDDALMEHPAVARAVSFAVPHATLGEDIAAAVVLSPHASATAQDLRRFARGRLADFKVPRQVLIVPSLPTSSTGKVARIGLAMRLGLTAGVPTSARSVAPRSPLEARLAELWAQLLDVESVGVHDDFFTAGGDSLLATHLLARVYDRWRVEVPASAFFEAPTVAEMARHVESLIAVGPGPAAIGAASRGGVAPASVAQADLWALQEALPGLPFFNILYALRLTGTLRVAALEQSLHEVVRRHEILRTTFAVSDGQIVQVIAPALHVPLVVDDLRDLSEADKEARGTDLVRAEALRSFDLTRGPLVHARLLRWDEGGGTLIVAMHQAIGDGWSLGVLTDELAALYDAFASGAPSPLAPVSMQYADFAAWQRQWASRDAVVAQLAYWRAQLREPLPALELVTDRPRRPGPGLRTARRPVAVPAELADAVERAGRREGVTVFTVLLAALTVLLRHEFGEDDVRVATLVANRNRPGADELIGPLVNTVVLRASVSGDLAVRELLRRLRAVTLAAYANQDLPFEDLVRALERERGVEPRSLSPVMLVLQNATLRARSRSARRLALEEANPSMFMPLVPATTFDVVLSLHEGARGLVGSCVYNADLFDAPTIDRMMDAFQQVLARVASGPERRISTIRPWGDGRGRAR